MSSAIENHVDWTAAATPGGDRAGPGLARRPRAEPQPPPGEQRSVMDTLLGEHDLAAFDASGSDPYNATGKHFRR